jgi:tetratricopeptide (TPR) repeat protein
LPHLNLAAALQALGHSDAAVLNAEEAVRLAPQDSGTHFNLGAILAEQGRRLNEAVEHLTRAEADYPKATLIKAEALLQKGDPDEAHTTLRRFLAMQSLRDVR